MTRVRVGVQRRLSAPAVRLTVLPLAAALLVFVVVRAAAAVYLSDAFLESRYETHDTLARNLADGRGFTMDGKPYAFELPVYPFVLSGAYATLGRSWWSVALLQGAVGAATLVLLFFFTRRLLGTAVAALTALAFAAYPYLAAQSAQIIDTTLFILALVAFLFFTARAATSERWWDGAGAGAAAGVAYLVRPTILAVAVAFPLLLALLGAGRRRVLVATGAALGAGLLVLTPWTIRNEIRFHEFIPGATKAGLAFWQGNNPRAGSYIRQGINLDAQLTLPDTPKPPPGLSEVETDRWWRSRGLDWIRDHPGGFLDAAAAKFVAFWSWELNPRTKSDSNLKQVLYTISYVPVLLLAVLGAAQLIRTRRTRELLFVLVPIALFTLIHMVIFGYTRLRVPIDLLLMGLAGTAAISLFASVRGRYGRAGVPSRKPT